MVVVLAASQAAAQVPGMPIPSGRDSAAVSAIFMRHARATGMTAQREAPRYMHVKQQMEMGGSPPVELEIFMILSSASVPEKIRSRMDMPGMGSMETVVNGKDGWMMSPMNPPMLLEPDQLKQALTTGNPDPLSGVPKGTFTLAPRATIDGREMDGVRVADTLGTDVLIYFDRKTGLASALRAGSSGGGARDTSTVMLISDYKPLDGLLMPTTLIMQQGGLAAMTMRVTQMDRAPIDTMMFVAPPAVVDLLKARKP